MKAKPMEQLFAFIVRPADVIFDCPEAVELVSAQSVADAGWKLQKAAKGPVNIKCVGTFERSQFGQRAKEPKAKETKKTDSLSLTKALSFIIADYSDKLTVDEILALESVSKKVELSFFE